MIEFNIPSMSCGHCVKAVTEAVHSVDAQAKVLADLDSKLVKVETGADQARIVEALTEAGYSPDVR